MRGRCDHGPRGQPPTQIGLFCMLQQMVTVELATVPNGGDARLI